MSYDGEKICDRGLLLPGRGGCATLQKRLPSHVCRCRRLFMSQTLACLLTAAPPCLWSEHGWKHFPMKGQTREHTRGAGNPAKYLPEFNSAAIEQLERDTVRVATRSPRGPSVAEYERDVGCVIGWDGGEDASVSYVECSGGERDGRAFHGRPRRT